MSLSGVRSTVELLLTGNFGFLSKFKLKTSESTPPNVTFRLWFSFYVLD